MHLFTPNEQIAIINHEIDTIEKIDIRKGSIDHINKKYSTLNKLKAMKAKCEHNIIKWSVKAPII